MKSRTLLTLTAFIAATSIALDLYFIGQVHASVLAIVRISGLTAFFAFYLGFWRLR